VLLPIVVGAMSVPYFVGEFGRSREDPGILARLHAACRLGEGEVVVASDTGTEMALSGRVTWAPWATAFLLRNGSFPLAAIESNFERPALACFVDRECDTTTPEPVPFDPASEHSVFRFELRDTVLRQLDLVGKTDGACIFRRPARQSRASLP
jgi:hypothetical protein